MTNIIILLIILIIAVVAIILSIIAFGKYNNLQKKYNIFMQGKDAETLEDFCLNLQKNMDVFMEDRDKTKAGQYIIKYDVSYETYKGSGTTTLYVDGNDDPDDQTE